MFMLFFGIAMIFIISPILTYFYGKRWYCSWVCGCGGLAMVIVIDIYPVRQTHPGKLNDG
jgi:polyferredoxin